MPNRSPYRVLLIEGRDGLAGPMLAAQSGFEIVPAERLPAAVRVVADKRAAGQACDILILDIMTSAAAVDPRDEGLDAFRLARALFPGLPIIAVCKHADGDIADTMISEGAQACLQKDRLDAGALAAAVRQAVIRSRAEARRFRMLFDSAPIGILLAVGRRVVMANPYALLSLGYAEEELAPLSVLELFPSASRSIVEKALDASGAGDIPEGRFTAELHRRDGSVLACQVAVKGALLNDAPAVALYLSPLGEPMSLQPDLASGHRAGDGIAPAGSHLRQTSKMEALGRLAGGVAHDFNNLLTAINGYSEHLLTLTDDAGPLAAGLKAIRRAGDTAAGMTRRLLTFSRADKTNAAPLPVDDTVGRMAQALRRLLGDGIDLRLELDAVAATVRLEPAEFEQVIMNLCLNAKEAMPGGGTLTVSTQAAAAGSGEAFTHLASGSGPHVVVTVEDTGTGMGRETLECLFEPFYSTKRGGRGAGLGLATVYGILNQSGGGISVSSAPGQGSRFRIFLSVDPPAMAASAALAAAKRAAPAAAWPTEGNRETILVVDDDTSLREMLRTVLERYGYKVLEAMSASEALEIAERSPEGIDLVITDVMLRGEGGHELAEKLGMLKSGQRIIFISGHSVETLGDLGITVPADAFLEKPFTPSQLAAKVRSLLDAAKRAT